MTENPQEASFRGVEWYDPAFLERLRALFLRLRKRRRRRRKAQVAPSMAFTREFKDYRSYSTNDDFRSVDWRVYARLGRLFVRLYEEVPQYEVHLVLDTSGSMERPHPGKRQNLLRLAVALGYLGLVGHHRVRVHTIRDRVALALPPLKGPGSIHRMIEALRGLEFGGVTNLASCFDEFRPNRQGYGVIFVLSDLLGQEIGAAKEALRRAASWPGETHVIQIIDPLERVPHWDGEMRLRDAETGEERKMWLTMRDRQRYGQLFEEFLREVEQACVSRQMDYQLWMTGREFEDFFTEFMERGSVLGGRG